MSSSSKLLHFAQRDGGATLLVGVFIIGALLLFGAGCKKAGPPPDSSTLFRDPAGFYSLEIPAGWSRFDQPESGATTFQFHRQVDDIQVADAELHLIVFQLSPGLSRSHAELDAWFREHASDIFDSSSYHPIGAPFVSREDKLIQIQYRVIGIDAYAGSQTILRLIVTPSYAIEVYAFAQAHDPVEQAELMTQIEDKLTTLHLRE